MLPVVAIVGRPNVGKSTLFNRLVGKRYAIESEISGTTRDRIYHEVYFRDIRSMLVDTAGLSFDNSEDNLEDDVASQANLAIAEADVILFVVDGREELSASDFHVAQILRKANKETVLIVNKCDDLRRMEEKTYSIYELGFEKNVFVSSLHSFGIDKAEAIIAELLISKAFNPGVKEEINEEYINICFLGRPNVGKSSLVNSIIKEDRLVVSDQPGTTRDSVDILCEYENKKFNLIDTAGVRRKGKIERGLEKFSVIRSLQAVSRCDIGLLVIDYSEGVTNQDCHNAHFILENYKGLIIVVNKVDLKEKGEDERNAFISHLQRELAFLPWAPVVFVSALTSKNVYKILDLAVQIKQQRNQRIKTSEFNDFVEITKLKHPPAMAGGKHRQPKLYYGVQVNVEPPYFVFFVNDESLFHFSYKRYLENEIRKKYGFEGTSIKMEFRNRKE